MQKYFSAVRQNLNGCSHIGTIHPWIFADGLFHNSIKRLKDGLRGIVHVIANERYGGLDGNLRTLFRWNWKLILNLSHLTVEMKCLGYKLMDFAPIVILLNTLLHRKPKETLSTVRNKYSHTIFHQVTKIPLLEINKLFESFPEVAKTLSDQRLTYQSIISTCSSSNQALPTEVKKEKSHNTLNKHKALPLPLIG
jgi:hypothetical protein